MEPKLHMQYNEYIVSDTSPEGTDGPGLYRASEGEIVCCTPDGVFR